MSSRTLGDHIELEPTPAGGKPRIRGRRIAIQDIAIWHERLGKNADEIAAEYDLALSDVYAALAYFYYFDHREEIDARIMTAGHHEDSPAAQETVDRRAATRPMIPRWA
jgi:uncharacterized protein (DUF433 family)